MNAEIRHGNDQVIAGLRICAGDGGCAGCAWRGTSVDCEDRQRFEAAALIEEMTVARPLGLFELSSVIGPMWIEVRADEDGEGAWRGWGILEGEDTEAGQIWFAVVGKSTRLLAEAKTYRKTWACWTMEPERGMFEE